MIKDILKNILLILEKKENEIINNKNKTEKNLKSIIFFLARNSSINCILDYMFDYSIELIMIEFIKINDSLDSNIWHILANMASTSSDACTQLLLNAGISDYISPFISRDIDKLDPKNLKEVIFLTSNICAGSISQVNHIIDCGIVNKIIDLNVQLSQLDLYDKKNIEFAKVKSIN